jgi:CheY-like chemotaxis protein
MIQCGTYRDQGKESAGRALAKRSTLTPCILDDDPAQLELLSDMIAGLVYESLPTSDPEEASRLLQSGACRLILADVHLPGADAYGFLDRVLRVDRGVHVIIISKEYTLESALEAIRRGAADFLPKPLNEVRLKRVLDDVAALYDQRRRVRALEEQLLKDLEFHRIVGKSPVMLEVFDFARKIARHYTNVLLVGPTGTGKELVARAIHQLSPVSAQRLAVCNCSAMVDTLLDLAWQRARARERNLQHSDYHYRRFYRSLRSAGKLSAPQQSHRRRSGVASAITRRSPQGAYPPGAADVHGQPLARGASVGYRAHQFVSLPETRPRGTGVSWEARAAAAG